MFSRLWVTQTTVLPSAGQVGEETHHLLVGAGVESAGGLVEKEHIRVGDQLHRQTDALELTAAQRLGRVDRELSLVGQADPLRAPARCRRRSRPALVSRAVEAAPCSAARRACGSCGGRCPAAAHSRYRSERGRRPVEIDTVVEDLSRRGRTPTVQRVHQGRLAGSAGPEDDDELAGLDDQIDRVEQIARLLGGAIDHRLGQAPCLDPHPVAGLGRFQGGARKSERRRSRRTRGRRDAADGSATLLSVDPGAVGAPEVFQPDAVVSEDQSGVLARDQRRVDRQTAAGQTADDDVDARRPRGQARIRRGSRGCALRCVRGLIARRPNRSGCHRTRPSHRRRPSSNPRICPPLSTTSASGSAASPIGPPATRAVHGGDAHRGTRMTM